MLYYFFYFFFSSRRRHTRLTCDWSSDVCSSDLPALVAAPLEEAIRGDEAAALAKRLGERRLAGEPLGAGVDERATRALLRPATRHEPPAQAPSLAGPGPRAADRQHRISRRDVVARFDLRHRRLAEHEAPRELCGIRVRERVSAAHVLGPKLARSRGGLGAVCAQSAIEPGLSVGKMAVASGGGETRQTREAQVLVPERACGFESHPPQD